MKIDYAIVSTNGSLLYEGFWEIVKKAWIDRIGIKPILVEICDEDLVIDYRDYIIYKIKKIPGFDTGFQSQIARMYITKFYKDNVCLTSDIDMLPINKDYFVNDIKEYDNDSLIIFSSDAYGEIRYPLCYNAAKGSVFSEILDLDNYSFEEYVKKLNSRGEGWNTDELYYGECVHNYKGNINIVKLIRGFPGNAKYRIDRSSWDYDKNNIDRYIDSHMLRPYHEYKNPIDKLLKLLNISI